MQKCKKNCPQVSRFTTRIAKLYPQNSGHRIDRTASSKSRTDRETDGAA